MTILKTVLFTFEANSIGQRLSIFNEKVAIQRFDENSLKESHKNYNLLFHCSLIIYFFWTSKVAFNLPFITIN
jgi:hypothetical protein